MITRENMKDVLTNWKVEEYIAYLYLSIATADMEVSKQEMEMIHKRLDLLLKCYYPKIHVDVMFLLNNLRALTETKSELEKMEMIDELTLKHRLSYEVKTQIVSDLMELVSVDDKVAFSEYHLMHYIRASFA